jgi:iron complex outermembrane receptor protein
LKARCATTARTAEAQTSGIERSHNGTSASLGAVWRFTPGYQVGTSFTRASRAPSAEELYAQGLHIATSTYERGNADLRSETQNIDVSLKKTSGDTTFGVSVFHNKINNYIYGRTRSTRWMACNCCSTARPTPPSPASKARCARPSRATWASRCLPTPCAAKLDGGGNLPHPGHRAGLRLDANWPPGRVRWNGCRWPAKTAWPSLKPPPRLRHAQPGRRLHGKLAESSLAVVREGHQPPPTA